MSRRKMTYLVLAIASFVVAACANPTAPQHDGCISGYEGSSTGITCTRTKQSHPKGVPSAGRAS